MSKQHYMQSAFGEVFTTERAIRRLRKTGLFNGEREYFLGV